MNPNHVMPDKHRGGFVPYGNIPLVPEMQITRAVPSSLSLLCKFMFLPRASGELVRDEYRREADFIDELAKRYQFSDDDTAKFFLQIIRLFKQIKERHWNSEPDIMLKEAGINLYSTDPAQVSIMALLGTSLFIWWLVGEDWLRGKKPILINPNGDPLDRYMAEVMKIISDRGKLSK
jgi:hypothetical protein